LFGGRRAIWVKAGSRNIVPALEAVMEMELKDTIVLVEAGALKRDSALRKLFEKERNAAAIECSHDNPEQLRALIAEEARKSGLSIDRETTELLSHSLGADRLTTRLELDKLLLYKLGEKEITSEDIEAVVADASALNLDAALNAAFSGRLDLVDETVGKALGAGNDAGILIGMASRYAVMLHQARLDVERGVPRDAALEKATRKAFMFPRKDALAAQFDRWSTLALARAIEILGMALSDCRKDARLAEAIATRAFWSIASAARRGRA
jgi:DNA polymerase-3 subunit delta